VLEKPKLVPGRAGNPIVSNQWLGEDQDLPAVGGVCHGFWVTNQRGGEDKLPCDRFRGPESLSIKGLAVLKLEGGRVGGKGGDRSS